MADIQKTLVLVKPDGVKKHICGEVISRFERKGLSIHAIKMINVPVELAEEHYAEHKGKGLLQGSHRFHHFRSCTGYGYRR